MFIHSNDAFSLYFGSASDNISKIIDCCPQSVSLTEHPKFKPLIERLAIKNLAFLNQTHSNFGLKIPFIVSDFSQKNCIESIPIFDSDGDYLITNQPNIGIGVMTADCVPLAIYDPIHHCAAIVHAGWRGSAADIISEALKHMAAAYQTKIEDCSFFTGPSARACCYQVSPDFKEHFKTIGYPESAFASKENQLHFDLPTVLTHQLIQKGAKPSSISNEYNFCTICDHRFFSFRRDGQLGGRQMSLIALRK